jgi:hypothetical protein
MQTFPYELINGYPILDMDGLRVLLHTGSAESMGGPGEITIEKKVFHLKRSTLRMTTASLGEKLGTPVDAMLGADIITQFDFKLLPEKKQVIFTSGEFHPYGYCNYFELFKGVPITPVSIFNQDMRLFFATGSRRTYFKQNWLQDLKPSGKTADYYPGLGVFETPLFKVTVWVAGYDVELVVGVPPAPLLSMLDQTNSQGILGVDVLQGFEVCLAPRRRESIWWKRGSGGGQELEGQRRDPNDVPGYYY